MMRLFVTHSLGARCAAACIGICMALTSIVPRFSLLAEENERVGAMLTGHQMVMQVFMLSIIPGRLVEKLMTEACRHSEPASESSPAPQNENTAANTSPDGAGVVTESIRTELMRAAWSGKSVHHRDLPWIPVACCIAAMVLVASAAAPPVGASWLRSRSLFFRCARSSIGDAGAVLRLLNSSAQLVL